MPTTNATIADHMRHGHELRRYWPFVTTCLVAAVAGAMVVLSLKTFLLLLGGLFVVVLVGATLVQPLIGFLATVFFLPFQASLTIDIGFNLTLSHVFLACLALSLLFRKTRLSPIPLAPWLAAYLAVAAASLSMGVLLPESSLTIVEIGGLRALPFLRPFVQLGLLAAGMLAYCLTLVVIDGEEKRLFMGIKAYVLGAFLVSLYAIYQFFALILGLPFADVLTASYTGGTTGESTPALLIEGIWIPRVFSVMNEPLNLAMFLLSVLPLLIFLHVRPVPGIRFHPLVTITILMTLILTFSRGGWIAFAVAMVVFFPLMARGGLKRVAWLTGLLGGTLLLAFLGMSMAGVSAASLPAILGERFASGFDITAERRYAIWLFGLELWQQFPILGVGLGNFVYYAQRHFASGQLLPIEGTWLAVLVETGTLGFVLFAGLILAYYRRMVSAIRRYGSTKWGMLLAGFAASSVAVMIEAQATIGQFPLFIWVTMALAVAAAQVAARDQGERPAPAVGK